MAGGVVLDPYIYPEGPYDRRHGPAGWEDYQRYRPWLRDEFTFRCVYCLERERWRDMRQVLHIDHFEPQARRPELKGEYTNLLYLCPACNLLKRDSILPDPCSVALGDCLRIFPDGHIEALQPEGKVVIDTLALDEPPARERRRIIIGTIRSLAQNNWPLYLNWMGFPEDLPDLSLPPSPPQNSKPEGVSQSYIEKRRRKELPEFY